MADDRERPLSVMINALRRDEGDSVTLLCDNPEGPPNNAIECNGGWTDWTDRRFVGETLRAAILAAYKARQECDPLGAPPPVDKPAPSGGVEVEGLTPEPRWVEIDRLKREIGVRQSRLQLLLLGDPTKSVSVAIRPAPSPVEGK